MSGIDGAVDAASRRFERTGTIVRREVETLRRTRTYLLLVGAVTAVVLGVGAAGGGFRAGFTSLVVDLMVPVELLAPVIALAFGYRAVLADAASDELDVLRTYPLSTVEYVLGIYLGRAVGVVVAVVVPLTVAGLVVVVTPVEAVSIYATNPATDSPVAYGRFVVLTTVLALAMLAVAIAVSALARSLWSALALAVGVALAVTVGGDLGLIAVIDPLGEALPYLFALSPNSAYRGLVLELAVGVEGPRAASLTASAIGLVGWTLAGLAVTTIVLRRDG